MKVTTTVETNCAVISKNKAMEFKIANSADFFHILSSSLYKHPMEAMIREIICNAWDAHVEANITRPIEITLTSEYLRIQDFGKGIPQDKIQQVYGTYGASTKVEDSNQTGGFGLGCKSPFAYTDNFEVTSCCNGTKTIYQMNKSSFDLDGKPTITPIVSVPTEKTGLAVLVNLKDPNELDNFSRIIEEIIYFSGEQALVNGVLQTSPIQFASDSSWVIYSSPIYVNRAVDSIYIRYGAVAYKIPILNKQEDISDIAKEYINNINEFDFYLRTLNNAVQDSGVVLIFKAEPNKLTVTPSREEIRVTETNLIYLNSLFKTFLSCIHRILHNKRYWINKSIVHNVNLFKPLTAITQSVKRVYLKKLKYCLTQEYQIGTLFSRWLTKDRELENVWFLFEEYFRFTVEDKTLLHKTIKYLQNQRREISKEYLYHANLPERGNYADWFYRVYKPYVLNKILEDKLLTKVTKFYIPRENSQYFKITSLTDKFNKNPVWVLDFALKNIIFVNVRDTEQLNDYINSLYNGYITNATLLYVLSSNQKQNEKVREWYSKNGFNIIDITLRVEPKVKKEKVKKEASTILSCHILNDGFFRGDTSTHWEFSRLYNTDWHLIDTTSEDFKKYKAVVKMNCKDCKFRAFLGFSGKLSNYIAKFYGHEVIVVKSKQEAEILQKKYNLLPFNTYLKDQVTKKILKRYDDFCLIYNSDAYWLNCCTRFFDQHDWDSRNACVRFIQKTEGLKEPFYKDVHTLQWFECNDEELVLLYKMYLYYKDSIDISIKVPRAIKKYLRDFMENNIRYMNTDLDFSKKDVREFVINHILGKHQ